MSYLVRNVAALPLSAVMITVRSPCRHARENGHIRRRRIS
jgi:hypothetical protein